MGKHTAKSRTAPHTNGYQVIVTDDGSRTLYSELHDETFHSESGAAAEAKLVFVQNSLVLERLQQRQATRVLEIGYGTGLNFLFSAEAAIKNGADLSYTGLDSKRLEPKLLERLGYDRFLDADMADFYRAWLDWQNNFPDKPEKGMAPRFEFRPGLMLELIFTDATSLEISEFEKFHAVFLDSFSPRSSPELWTAEMFQKLLDCLLDEGRLVTYCVKSEIQRRLKRVGFDVQKTRGPKNGKREVLVAIKKH